MNPEDAVPMVPSKLLGLLAAFVLLLIGQLSSPCNAAASASASASADYRVGPGDLLRISVFGYPDLAGDVRVSQSGNITFPLIGSVDVAGSSPRDIETKLSSRLASGHFIRQSQVTVLVVEFQSARVAVMGEVTNPGQYPLQGSRRVLNMLADAGGVIMASAGDQVVLIRADGSRVQLDIDAMLNGSPEQNPVVAAGDTVNVPKAPQFYIYGEVNKPGIYRLERDMTVSQAISAGGGLTRRGTERSVVVKRKTGSSATAKVQEIKQRGSDKVQPNDVLLIKESWF